MSSKPRLLKLAPVADDPPATLAAKVTGHNLANITYLVSRAAERGGYEFEFKAKFSTDGSLITVSVPGMGGESYRALGGMWLFLKPELDYLTWGMGHPVQQGHFRELA